MIGRRAAGRPSAGSPLAWLGALLALYLSVPIVAFLIRLAGSDERGFTSPGVFDALWVSVQSATISTAIIVVFGVPLAHWLARATGPVAAVVGVLVQLPLALPPVMSGIVLIYLVGPRTRIGEFFDGRLTGSVAGIVIAQTFVAAPFLIIAARSAFAAVDPALEDLAATLGHRSLARFWRVALPLAAPSIRAGLLLTWLRALGEYGATVLLSYHPYSLPVYTYVQFSGTGLPTTQAPTALALGAAAVAVVLSRVRRPAGSRRPTRLPAPEPPPPAVATPVSFDLDFAVGTFHLQLRHSARSHRLAVLGPSGSGKSMLLRSLAGLLGPAVGDVRYGGEEVAALPPEARGIGYVPQGLGLFPGRTVWQQMLFATRADPRIASWWLATLRLDGLADRLPGEISGGQRQRVSLAQAFAHSPRLVLLDEPFSALDAPVRDELRRELRRLQRELSVSTVLVTHDPEEAALLADEVLVIADGRLLQAGSTHDVYHRPASPEVARLLGIQNLTAGVVVSPTELAAGRLTLTTAPHRLPIGTDVLWCVRPDHVRVTSAAVGSAAADGVAPYRAVVTDIADLGSLTTLIVRLDGGPELRVRTTLPVDLAPDQPCQVLLDPADVTLWPRTETPSPVPGVGEGLLAG